MENNPFQQGQFSMTDPIPEEFPLGTSHSFTRKNRGRRTQIVDEEAKKLDDEFWNNNPLFRESHVETVEVVNILDFPVKEDENNDPEIHISHEINTVNHEEDIYVYPKEDRNGEEQEEEQENEDGEGEENEGDEDDDEDDEEYEQIASSEEMAMSIDDEELEKSPQKEAEAGANEPDPEKEKEEMTANLFAKNRENHLFYRPVFLKLDLADYDKYNFSYIKLPEELPTGKNENDLSRQNINRKYIGVPPRAPEEYRLPMHFPTMYNREMFKCEDERYMIDLNIIKYKAIIKALDNICALEDDEEKKNMLADIVATNKTVKRKYDFDETEDDIEKLGNMVNEFQHDLENLYKKRAYSDIMTKKKKELYYPLAVRDCEFNYASNERQQLSNSKLVDEMTKNYLKVPLKRLNSSSTEEILDYETFSETFTSLFYQTDLHKVLFNNQEFHNTFETQLQSLFASYRASPYSILPTNLFYISNKQLFNKAVQLVLYSIKHSSYFDNETLPQKLTALIQNYFGFEMPDEETAFDIDSPAFQEVLDELTKYEHFKPRDFMKPAHAECLPKEINLTGTTNGTHGTFNNDFNLFIPSSAGNGSTQISYGTHYFFFVTKYFYIIYLKFLLVSNLSDQEATSVKISHSSFDVFLNLTAAYILDKINNSRYELSVVNLFGSNAKYLLNIKSILGQVSKGLISLIDDTVSFELMEKVIEKKKANEPERDIFNFTCEYMNSTDDDGESGNFVYRFHSDPSKGWFFTSVFDVKGVFMRALKTQDRVGAALDASNRTSLKKVVVKRSIKPSNGDSEVPMETEDQTLLGKRSERESEKIEGPVSAEDPDPLKKVHID